MNFRNFLTKTVLLTTITASFHWAQASSTPLELLDQALDKNARSELQKIEAVIQSDSLLNKKIQQLQASVEAIARNGKSDRIKLLLHQQEVAKYAGDFKLIFAKAHFNPDLHFKNQQALVAKFNSKYKSKVTIARKGDLSYVIWEELDFGAPTEDAEIELTRPFPLQERQATGPGRLSIDATEGTYFASANDNRGSFTNHAGLGHFFRVPRGTRKIRISTRLPEFASILSGYATLGSGMSQTTAQIIIDGEAGPLCESPRVKHTLRVYFFDTGYEVRNQNLLSSCEFTAPPPGQDVVIRFLSSATVDAFFATTSSSVGAAPDAIRIRLNPLP